MEISARAKHDKHRPHSFGDACTERSIGHFCAVHIDLNTHNGLKDAPPRVDILERLP
jgi:hypothetical protein